jgi:hypothetical protein
MRNLVGFSWLVGLSSGLFFGCGGSTVTTPAPVQGGKCDTPTESVIAKDGCTKCTCGAHDTWDCSGNTCMGSGGSSAGTSGSPSAGKGGGSTMGTGGSTMGTGGSTMGTGGGTMGTGGSTMGTGGSTMSTGGTDMGSAGGPTACAPGETVMEAGCQVCTCSADGSGWSCTTSVCNDECPPPVAFDPNGCASAGGYALNPGTGYCCAYGSSCAAPQGWSIFDTPDCMPSMVGCPKETADCDGDPGNGCETDLMSPENCGRCGNECPAPAGTMAACTYGICYTVMLPPPPQCVYGGADYNAGDSFPARDGCNTCDCVSNADNTVSVSCTEQACVCNPDAELYRKYSTTSPDACMTADITCPDNTTMFTNDCGCGCEQSEQCPDVFDCAVQDHMVCDRSLIATCPYSTVQTTPTN